MAFVYAIMEEHDKRDVESYWTVPLTFTGTADVNFNKISWDIPHFSGVRCMILRFTMQIMLLIMLSLTTIFNIRNNLLTKTTKLNLVPYLVPKRPLLFLVKSWQYLTVHVREAELHSYTGC